MAVKKSSRRKRPKLPDAINFLEALDELRKLQQKADVVVLRNSIVQALLKPLERLEAKAQLERTCVFCGCSQYEPCSIGYEGETCGWASDDRSKPPVCTSCAAN